MRLPHSTRAQIGPDMGWGSVFPIYGFGSIRHVTEYGEQPEYICI